MGVSPSEILLIKNNRKMSTLVLKVNNEIYQRTERDEFGTVRQAIKEFANANSFKGAKCVPVNATNLGTEGKQILLVIKEVDDKKRPEDLAVSDTIHVGREISDMIRSGEIAFSSLLEFPIINQYTCIEMKHVRIIKVGKNVFTR